MRSSYLKDNLLRTKFLRTSRSNQKHSKNTNNAFHVKSNPSPVGILAKSRPSSVQFDYIASENIKNLFSSG